MKRCPAHRDKRCYPLRVDALIALADIQRKDRPTAREQRVYFCHDCHGYYLTSQPRRTGRAA